MGKKSHRRKSGLREPSGRLSRQTRVEVRAAAPAEIVQLREKALAGLADGLWGTPLGQMHLRGQIDAIQLEAGKRWFNLIAVYRRIIGAAGIRASNLEIGAGNAAPDPDSELGRRIVEREVAIRQDYERALKALGSGGNADRALRCLENGQALDYVSQHFAICGLDVLAAHYRLLDKRKGGVL